MQLKLREIRQIIFLLTVVYLEEQTLDIMEMGNNYAFRNHRFDVVDQSHGAAMDPSMLSLISYLADRGVRGSLLQTENYDKSHYLEL